MKLSKLIIGAGLVFPTLLSAQKVEMTLNLENGKTYVQKSILESTVSQTMMGQNIEVKTSSDSSINIKKIKEAGEIDTYEASYGDITLTSSQMGQTQIMSSDTASLESVDGLSRAFAMLANKNFEVTMSGKGVVQEVNGLEEMVAEAMKNVPSGPGMAQMIESSVGINGFTKNLEMTTDIYPDKKVKVGDSWSKEQFVSVGLPIVSTATYTLKSISDGVATIDVKGTFATDPNNSTTELQGMEATQYFEGTRSGTMTIEVSTGWVTSGDLEDDIVGSMTFAPNTQIPDGMTIPIEVKNNIKISN
ncbi:MAG: DUF6263 family protein [Flavobacteriales bacterium]|nr:DUF6263 family protein [Flavobacteriales bacterium]